MKTVLSPDTGVSTIDICIQTFTDWTANLAHLATIYALSSSAHIKNIMGFSNFFHILVISKLIKKCFYLFLGATGIMTQLAQGQGFASVHHYLESLMKKHNK